MLIWLLAAFAVAALALILSLAWAWAWYGRNEKHAPVEYYASFAGYRQPLHLTRKLTQDEAEAQAEAGYAYYIGYFDIDGKLVRVVKMFEDSASYEYAYTYHPGGRLKSVYSASSAGRPIVREYDESGRER